MACTRVTSPEGLYISNLDIAKYAVNVAVTMFLAHARVHRRLKLRPEPLCKSSNTGFCIMSHNVRSLVKYKEDVEAEHDIKHVHLLHMTETRYTDSQQILGIGRLKEICRIPSDIDKKGNSMHGSILLAAEETSMSYTEGHRYNGGIEVIFTGTHEDILFAGIYIPPHVAMTLILDVFKIIVQKSKDYTVTSILGDFNMDMRQDVDRSRPLQSFLRDNGFEQQPTGPTHDSKREIDQIWVRNTKQLELQTGATESYYSDHKPIWLSIS